MLGKKRSTLPKLFLSLLLCVGGGWLTGLFTNPGLTTGWYPALLKSSLTPAGIVFPITWTVLYVLMGFSLYLVWEKPKKTTKRAISFFFIQLLFNFLWSFIFFYEKSIGLALVDIAFLWVSVAITIALFFKLSKTAAYLLVPYLIWVSFACYLNFYIWAHNP